MSSLQDKRAVCAYVSLLTGEPRSLIELFLDFDLRRRARVSLLRADADVFRQIAFTPAPKNQLFVDPISRRFRIRRTLRQVSLPRSDFQLDGFRPGSLSHQTLAKWLRAHWRSYTGLDPLHLPIHDQVPGQGRRRYAPWEIAAASAWRTNDEIARRESPGPGPHVLEPSDLDHLGWEAMAFGCTDADRVDGRLQPHCHSPGYRWNPVTGELSG